MKRDCSTASTDSKVVFNIFTTYQRYKRTINGHGMCLMNSVSEKECLINEFWYFCFKKNVAAAL